jgi:aryl carrier-like protein
MHFRSDHNAPIVLDLERHADRDRIERILGMEPCRVSGCAFDRRSGPRQNLEPKFRMKSFDIQVDRNSDLFPLQDLLIVGLDSVTWLAAVIGLRRRGPNFTRSMFLACPRWLQNYN